MGVLHTPSRHTFECDGTQRVFPIPSLMISQDFVRIEIDGVLQSDRKQWDIVNNSLVFVLAPISGAILDVQVASDSESLGELGMISNVDILAKNITNVNKVANIDTDVTKVADIDLDVTTVASIVSEIPIVSAISTDVATVASISSEVITVAGIETDVTTVANISSDVTTVANNIVDVQNAEENAIIAKEEAWRAEAERLTANSYATEPEDVYVKIYTSNNDGTFTITDTTDYSSYHYERKATTLITTGIINDVTSYADRTYSSNKIDSIVSTINNNITPIENSIGVIEGDIVALDGRVSDLENDVSSLDNTTVKLTENQTIEDVKTFIVSPIVPTPTAGTQVANKEYVDTKQSKLGFVPVQQGTGIGQLNSTVKIGWTGSRTKITINETDTGNIVMDSDIGVANSSLVKTALNASGTAPIYACRAWVNFNGTGTVAIRASGNVSSITDNGIGDYTVNFTTAMPDGNYSLNGMSGDITNGARPLVRVILVGNMLGNYVLKTANAVRVAVWDVDAFEMNITIFR